MKGSEGIQNQPASNEKLTHVVGQFVRMMDTPDRFGSQIELIANEMDSVNLSEAAQDAMDQLLKRLRVILPTEYESVSDAELEVALRATLELSRI